MIVILASIYNKKAAAFVKKFSGAAALLTCRDLAEQKIKLCFPDFSASEISISGQTIFIHQIKGIINLLPGLIPEELFFFPEEEREYQSAEFYAMLTFFLSKLTCPIINRPSVLSLSGGFNYPLQWIQLAIQLKIPVVEVMLNSEDVSNPYYKEKDDRVCEVVFFNSKIISSYSSLADDYTQRLAVYSGLIYLKTIFKKVKKRVELIRVSTIADIQNKRVAQEIFTYFQNCTV